jgi:hypothetical protein
MTGNSLFEQLAAEGYAVVPDMFSFEEIRDVVSNFRQLATQSAGTRRLLEVPGCRALARRLAGNPQLSTLMPSDAQAVQCTLFEKALDNNWLVSLHQDLSIPVAERIDSAQCTGSRSSANAFNHS